MCDRWAEVMNSARLRGLFDHKPPTLGCRHRLLLTTRPMVSFVNVESVDRNYLFDLSPLQSRVASRILGVFTSA